jgi:hypothetical protein
VKQEIDMPVPLDNDQLASTLVTTPADMAQVLLDASAFSAAAYALAAHEDACERGDDRRVEFWRDVCETLTALRTELDRPTRSAA